MADLGLPTAPWRSARRLRSAALLLVAFVIGGLSTMSAYATLGACAVVALAAWVWARPAVAAYLLIVLTPLTVGVDRGLVVPVLRPSEALAVLLAGVLAVRGVTRLRTRGIAALRIDAVERSMILLAVTSSVVP